MSNITQNLKGYVEKAVDTLYNVAVDPILTKVASIDFAGSYFKNPGVPEYRKYATVRRLANDNSAILGLTDYPAGEGIKWKELIEAGMVVTAAAGGLAIAKKYDLGMDDVDAGIAYAQAGASDFFSGILNLFEGESLSWQIDTPADKIIAGEKIVLNASENPGKQYTWFIQKDGQRVQESESTKTPYLEKVFSEGSYKIVPAVTDENGNQKLGEAINIDVKPAPAPPAPTPTPEMPYTMYNGIKIQGDEQFQKDVVMSLEFAKKFSPPDYEFIMKNNKLIGEANLENFKDEHGNSVAAVSYGEGFYFDKGALRQDIENKGTIVYSVETGVHESEHNFMYKTNMKEFRNEEFAGNAQFKARANLSQVHKEDIDKFYQEFDFSQFQNKR